MYYLVSFNTLHVPFDSILLSQGTNNVLAIIRQDNDTKTYCTFARARELVHACVCVLARLSKK